MDRETVIRHLRAWADGVDPTTGETLPPDHPGQRPGTLRVVFGALVLLQAEPPAAARGPARTEALAGARNAGRPWSPQDDAALEQGFDAGDSVGALATRFERTRGAINARLVRLGKIDLPPGLRLRGEAGGYGTREADEPDPAPVPALRPS